MAYMRRQPSKPSNGVYDGKHELAYCWISSIQSVCRHIEIPRLELDGEFVRNTHRVEGKITSRGRDPEKTAQRLPLCESMSTCINTLRQDQSLAARIQH